MERLDGAVQWSRETDRMCSSCARKGQQRKLQAFQLNFEEAVYMCPDAECLFPLDERNLDSIVIKRKLDINDVGGNVKRKKRKQVSSDRFLCTTGTASCVSHEFIQPQEGQTTAVVSKPALGLQLTSGNRVINFNYGSRQRVIPCHETFQSYVKSSTSSAMPPVVTSSFVSRAQPCHISSSNARSLAQSLIAPAIADNEILLVAQSHSVTSPALPPLNGMSLEDNKMQLGQDGNQGELPSKSNPEKSLEKGTVEQLKHSSRRQEHLQFSSAKHLSELTMEHSTSNTNPSNTGGDEKDLVGGSKTDLKLSRSREDLSSVLADRLFLHWTNSDAMCWLDVAMAMIVHCQSLRHAVVSDINTEQSSCIRKLLREYDRAQADFRRSSKLNRCHYLCGQGKMVKLETSVGHITVKTGGGSNGAGLQLGALVNPADQIATIDVDDVSEIICDSDKNTTSVERVSQVARHLDEQAKQILVDVREHVFSVMQETMQCERGQNDSALLALSSLLTEDAYVSEQFLVKYTFSLECGKCSHVEANRVSKEVPTFMKLPEDFAMTSPSFLRTCFSCGQPDQLLQINFDKLPDAFFCHFLHGVVHSDVTKYDFYREGRYFFVTGVVQHCTKPSHFVCHIRQLDGNLWMTYDDLKSPAVCRFKQQVLAIPPSEVHLLLWESRPATISLADLPPKPLAALTKPSSPPLSVVQSFVRSSAFVSSAISTAERRASTSAAILATDASPLPVGRLSLSAVPPRTTSTGPRRPVAPQVFVGPTPPAASSEDRLQRARERFLRDKQGVLGSTVGTVIPSPMSAVSNVGPGTVVKSYGTSTRTDAERARSTYSHRKRFQPPCTFNSTSAAVSAVTGPLPTVTTPRLRAAFHNTYGSVLPLLHKRSGGTAYGSPMFTGYVPKAKQATTTADRCRVPSSSELPTNVIAASEPTQDENRRPKVCFALPAKANSSCNGRGGAATTDISTGITSYHPKSGVVSSSTADRSQPTDVVANTTVSQSVVVCQNAFQSSPDILPLSVVASGANGSLTGVTAARENHVSFVTVQNSTNGENLSSDENARRVADPLTDVVDDWLCNEIYTSDIFKNNGLCPENMLGELLSSVGNGCQPDDSTGASPSCDILNGDSSNYTNDDLSIIDPVTQFTFDDMLSYLYN